MIRRNPAARRLGGVSVTAAKLLALASVLAALVALPGAAPQQRYRPVRWSRPPVELTVTNPPPVNEDIIAVHAIRWRPRGLGGTGTVVHYWEFVLEIANISRFEIAIVELAFGPATKFGTTYPPTTITAQFILERGKPHWYVFQPYLPPPPPPDAAPGPPQPSGGKFDNVPPRPPRKTNVTRKKAVPRFDDVTVTVVAVREWIAPAPPEEPR